jgi:hypothetical protein
VQDVAFMKFRNFPIYRIEWVTSAFLIGTALLALTVVPWFLWNHYSDVQGWGFRTSPSGPSGP